LHTAINRPPSFYLSLDDYIHKDRLIIPFYKDNKIEFYQSRKLLEEDMMPKYLSKVGGDKILYGIDRIDSFAEYVFILEGPIDAMFVRNGLGACGTNLTEQQESQLSGLLAKNIIYIFDNQYIDETAKEKTNQAISQGKSVFIYPEEYKMFKDFNEICIDRGWDEIPQQKILENVFQGFDAKVKMMSI
jgi:hypothetical protein